MSKRAKEAWAAIGLAIFAGSDVFTQHAGWHRVVAGIVAAVALISLANVLRRPVDALPANALPAGAVELPIGATPVVFPSFGESARSGRVVRWLKAPGDHVKAGDPLVEIETDKAVVEMPAPVGGVLCDGLAPSGRNIDTCTAIAGILPSASGAAIATRPIEIGEK